MILHSTPVTLFLISQRKKSTFFCILGSISIVDIAIEYCIVERPQRKETPKETRDTSIDGEKVSQFTDF